MRFNETQISGFVEWLSEECLEIFTTSYDGLEKCLDQLVISDKERDIYEKVRQEWAKDQGYNGGYADIDLYIKRRKRAIEKLEKNHPNLSTREIFECIKSLEEYGVEKRDAERQEWFDWAKEKAPELPDSVIWQIIWNNPLNNNKARQMLLPRDEKQQYESDEIDRGNPLPGPI